jgi:hypothetical protein
MAVSVEVASGKRQHIVQGVKLAFVTLTVNDSASAFTI